MDLVTELLQCREHNYTLLERAADEIERLRNDLKEMEAIMGAIDAALDQTLREALGLSFKGKVT
jgi:hypothetical protein